MIVSEETAKHIADALERLSEAVEPKPTFRDIVTAALQNAGMEPSKTATRPNALSRHLKRYEASNCRINRPIKPHH